MDDKTQLDSKVTRLLVNIYEEINIYMDLQRIFEVVFSELFSVVEGESGIIQINSMDKLENYYGYSNKEGIEFWEPNEVYPCPDFMNTIINTIADMSVEQKSKTFFFVSNIFYAEIRSNDQNYGYIAVIFEPVKNESAGDRILDILGAVARQIAIIIDKKKALEKKEYLQKMSLLRSTLSSLSHDMKNPLSGISGFVQLIAQKSEDDSIKKYCSIILESLTQLEEINSEFRNIINKNSLILYKSEVSLYSCIDDVCKKLSGMYKHEGVDISIDTSSDIVIQADNEKLVKVFKNIFRNSKEAMPDGGKLGVKLRKNDITAVIEISDTGKGIPSLLKDKVFESFCTYGRENAAGLGLTVARSIIEEHGGTISFSSMLGKGTVFTIHLPLAKKEA